MHAEQTTCAPKRRRKPRRPAPGFSLVELMAVVAIVAILAAIAIPTFEGYLNKARTAEATEFLGVIKLREESYRSEFGQYCPTVAAGSAGLTDLDTHSKLVPNPNTVVTLRKSVQFLPNAGFTALGATPGGDVRFGYGVSAGTPTDLPPAILGWNSSNADFWFIARAVADLDYDGIFITFETYSASKNVWIGSAENANAAAKGWE